jgi:2'-hydroxyisoflavone reductase
VINAVGPAAPITMRELLAAVAAGVKVDPALTWVEEPFLEQAKVSPWSDLPVWMGRDDPLSRCSNARALAAGLTCRPLDETSRDTLAWWRGLPEERRGAPRAGLSAAREAEVLAAWRARKAG